MAAVLAHVLIPLKLSFSSFCSRALLLENSESGLFVTVLQWKLPVPSGRKHIKITLQVRGVH